jgi:NO-binding membrane sensor protein with MHYT domain
MWTDFFQFGPLPLNQIEGFYDMRLVILSYLVATFASYIALDITGRLRDASNTRYASLLWLLGGAFAMGAGIWSMHFIGMLAFNMPGMNMVFDPWWTVLSMLVAILASSFALYLLKAKVIKTIHLVLGGVILGISIASMHYVGMHAMKIMVNIHYLPSLFLLSILIAIIASEAALYLALKSNQVIPTMRFRLKLISAFIMGAAICGMHYTGMTAAVFTPIEPMIMQSSSLNPEILAISIAGVTFLILGIAILASTYKEAQNQKMLATARQAGMAEVAASVLHNVGNVLNSVNVSAVMVGEQIAKSKLSQLTLLSHLLNEHANDLHQFISEDPRGSQLPAFIKGLSDYWIVQQDTLNEEINLLIKNIEHIKNIISMQQNLSKVKKMNEVVSIEKTLEEALFITGIETNHPDVIIERKFRSLHPIIIDKVKLLQILVNLLHNAKEALIESNNHPKKIKLKITFNGKDKCSILIEDNGIGIPSKNLTYIFSYGFTTKKEGHGFGLHSCALAAKEMGGTIIANSEGLGKGAQFELELPYILPRK